MAERRRWIQKRWENVSMEDVFSWLNHNASSIEVESLVVSCRYDYKGIFFQSRRWYFEKFSLRYYPNSPGHVYGYAYASNNDGFFKSGKTKCYETINSYINNPKRIITDYYRSARYSGGNGAKVHFVFAFWEEN